jgi:hypothetical protein
MLQWSDVVNMARNLNLAATRNIVKNKGEWQ